MDALIHAPHTGTPRGGNNNSIFGGSENAGSITGKYSSSQASVGFGGNNRNPTALVVPGGVSRESRNRMTMSQNQLADAQDIANTAWAFATLGQFVEQLDEKLLGLHSSRTVSASPRRSNADSVYLLPGVQRAEAAAATQSAAAAPEVVRVRHDVVVLEHTQNIPQRPVELRPRVSGARTRPGARRTTKSVSMYRPPWW